MKLFSLFILLNFCVYANTLSAQDSDTELNIERLWLPKTYAKYWTDLREVAEHQLAQPRCTEVVRGELDRGASREEAPVFAVICRDQNRKTYVVKYDGLSKQPLIPIVLPQAEEEVITPVDIELVIYQNCQASWLNDVALMNKMRWLDDFDDSSASKRDEISIDSDVQQDAEPPSRTTITQYSFVRRFDAEDAAGNSLKYNANCVATGAGDIVTNITIRRD